jgi:hypothetical protein
MSGQPALDDEDDVDAAETAPDPSAYGSSLLPPPPAPLVQHHDGRQEGGAPPENGRALPEPGLLPLLAAGPGIVCAATPGPPSQAANIGDKAAAGAGGRKFATTPSPSLDVSSHGTIVARGEIAFASYPSAEMAVASGMGLLRRPIPLAAAPALTSNSDMTMVSDHDPLSQPSGDDSDVRHRIPAPPSVPDSEEALPEIRASLTWQWTCGPEPHVPRQEQPAVTRP